MAHHFGWHVLSIEIHARCYCGFRSPLNAPCDQHIVVALAGQAAEHYTHCRELMTDDDLEYAIYDARNVMEFGESEDEELYGDTEAVFELLLRENPSASDPELIERYRTFEQLSRTIVSSPRIWRAIEVVATQLISGDLTLNANSVVAAAFASTLTEHRPTPARGHVDRGQSDEPAARASE